ncbi:MAG: J domain-containing protein [Clostridia bacterium]|nr:J domain-containing protein [Clostridia bacterium]
MKNPYQVLGVDPTASDEEIKTAYRNLARKYHPDKYRDSDLAEMAEEKMKEVNAAYEEIQQMRAKGSTGSAGNGYDPNGYGQSGYGGYQGNYQGGYAQGKGSTPFYIQVRQLINARRVAEAEQMLNTVPEADRGAEWQFLMGCVCINRGFYVDAQHFFDTACAMDPQNAEYRNAQQRARQAQSGGFTGHSSTGSSCSICDICAALACLDCLCDCF